jgi:hypothetical protein
MGGFMVEGRMHADAQVGAGGVVVGRGLAGRGPGLLEDLAALDRLLSDPALMGPIVERFRREWREMGRLVLSEGRPTIARWRALSG